MLIRSYDLSGQLPNSNDYLYVIIETRNLKFKLRSAGIDPKSSPTGLTANVIGIIIHGSISLILAIAAIVVLITYVKRHYAA